MAKRKNRIDFYKTLVCPDEVRSGEVDFFDWCNDVISAESFQAIKEHVKKYI